MGTKGFITHEASSEEPLVNESKLEIFTLDRLSLVFVVQKGKYFWKEWDLNLVSLLTEGESLKETNPSSTSRKVSTLNTVFVALAIAIFL